MGSTKPVFLPPGDGDTLAGMGVEVVHKARSSDTGGGWSLVEYTASPGFRIPPPHYHEAMTESFYVLSGELTVQLGEQRHPAPAGSFTLVPPGTVHTFANESVKPVTFLLFMSPGGFESYFDDVARLAEEEGGWPPADMDKVAAIQARYDLRYPEPELMHGS